ncbi:MAG: MOP flippase family protein [Cyanobacteria bacterium P01_H01_bin.35]
MNLQQKAVKGIIWSALQKIGSQLISFIVFFLLARLLQPEDFGLISLASVSLAFIEVFLDQGFAQAIVQREELEPEHLDTAFWTSLCLSTLLMSIVITIAGFFAQTFEEPELIPIVRCLSLSFLFFAFNSVPQALFQRQLAFKELAIRSLLASLFGGGVGVSMAFLGFGAWSLVGQQLVNGLVGIIFLWWAVDWRPGLKVSSRHFKELFAYGANILGFNILQFFNRRSDDFLIGYFLGSVALGYYTVAYRLLVTVTQLMRTMSQVALPTFSRLQSEPEKLRTGFYNGIQFISLIAFPVFIGLAILAPELIVALFGEQWTPSIPVMRVLAFIGIAHSLNGIATGLIAAMGKPNWNLKVNILNAALNVTAFILVVRWGIVAVAVAFVIRGFLVPLPIFILMVRKLIQIELVTYIRQCSTPIIATLGMSMTIFGIQYLLGDLINLYFLIAIYVLLGATIYTLIVMLIDPKLFKQLLALIKLGSSRQTEKSL